MYVSIAAGGKIWEERDIWKILLQNHGLLMLFMVGRVATWLTSQYLISLFSHKEPPEEEIQSLPLPRPKTELVLSAVQLPIRWLLCVEINGPFCLFLSIFSGVFPMVLSEEGCPPGII